jgi:hypothetical protein
MKAAILAIVAAARCRRRQVWTATARSASEQTASPAHCPIYRTTCPPND